MINGLILKQFAKEFNRIIEEILLREREEYLKEITFMLDDIIRAMFIAGVSSRKTGEVIKNLIGLTI